MFVIVATLAAVHEGRFWGYSPQPSEQTITSGAGGEIVINTTEIGKDITGYGGPVPLDIYVSDGVIDSIKPLVNSESPAFFNRLEKSGLTHAWDGKTLAEATTMEVDAVTGATYSSRAFIANVRAGAAYASDKALSTDNTRRAGVKEYLILAVILCGAIVPLFVKNKKYRIVQQLANAGVLGFWGGTFIDYAMMMNFFANGVTMTIASVTTALLLCVGFIYPLAGKKSYYCAWICPFGSLQELASDICGIKIHLSAKTVKRLTTFKQILWIALITLLYLGIGAQWIDYEIFTAFIVTSASWIVITIGALFIVLSLFINRPFCHFVCPTGNLLGQI